MCRSGKKSVIVAVVVPILVLVAFATTFFVYTGIYYHADESAVGAFLEENKDVQMSKEGSTLVFKGEEEKAGFVFYPGGKVEYTAYSPLMTALAKQGFVCFLVKMPFNLAVFNSSAAKKITSDHQEIETWYIGGHSLGGSMAANYLSSHAEDFKGLLLLGSYSVKNLSETNLKVLSVYGSEDKVLNAKKYQENKKNLPASFREEVIQGGCHAYFGTYGKQKGDGAPTISNKEQIERTALFTKEFFA